jgi:hypothetical protein
MALKLAEIKSPYKILRDLPMSGKDPIAAERLSPAEQGDKFTLSLTEAAEKVSFAEIPPVKDPHADFAVMKLVDLHRHKYKEEFILTPQHMMDKLAATPAPQPAPAAPVPEPTPVSEPVVTAAAEPAPDAPLSTEDVNKLLGD